MGLITLRINIAIGSDHPVITNSMKKIISIITLDQSSYKDRGDSQHVDRPYMDPDTEYRRKERCMKCGFDNHVTDECKHQTQVQCFRCGLYGHKNSSGLCWTR